MNNLTRSKAIEKLAFFGPAGVNGSPAYNTPPPTVGQMMYNAGYNALFSGNQRRQVLNGIVNTGLNVNSPAKSLLHAGLGALAGNFVANTLKQGPFMRGVLTAAGANYGYNH